MRAVLPGFFIGAIIFLRAYDATLLKINMSDNFGAIVHRAFCRAVVPKARGSGVMHTLSQPVQGLGGG
jgi:hypothetical protein